MLKKLMLGCFLLASFFLGAATESCRVTLYFGGDFPAATTESAVRLSTSKKYIVPFDVKRFKVVFDFYKEDLEWFEFRFFTGEGSLEDIKKTQRGKGYETFCALAARKPLVLVFMIFCPTPAERDRRFAEKNPLD